MTPHYEWTPASEPPDTDRDVLVWLVPPTPREEWSDWDSGFYSHEERRWSSKWITHWRDVEPPSHQLITRT